MRNVTTPEALLVFAGSLALTLSAAAVFGRRLDALGTRLGATEAVIGLMTALAADAPELSAAVIATIRGDHDLGVGVLLGSNAFNLAAMVGITLLVGSRIAVPLRTLRAEAIATALTLVGAVVVMAGVVPPLLVLALLAVATIPYARELEYRRVPRAIRPRPVAAAISVLALELPAVVLVVIGCVGLVDSATTLADHVSLPRATTGFLILAIATSLPNVYTGLRFGLAGRGSALVSETLNSNSINLLGGLIIPSIVLAAPALNGLIAVNVVAVAVLTVIALRGAEGGGRPAGLVLVGGFVAIAAVNVVAG
jgi:cation:H+ antiporter